MKSWKEKLADWFAAAAFAEAGEHETALRLAGLESRASKRSASVMQTLNDSFAAAAFAEADCQETAIEILASGKKEQGFLDKVGLRGVRVRYGFVPAGTDFFLDAVGLTRVPVRFLTVRI
ncbi:MAG: hypothetical protein P8182_05770 [Deltaproteobacteria bacterium]